MLADHIADAPTGSAAGGQVDENTESFPSGPEVLQSSIEVVPVCAAADGLDLWSGNITVLQDMIRNYAHQVCAGAHGMLGIGVFVLAKGTLIRTYKDQYVRIRMPFAADKIIDGCTHHPRHMLTGQFIRSRVFVQRIITFSERCRSGDVSLLTHWRSHTLNSAMAAPLRIETHCTTVTAPARITGVQADLRA